MNHRNNYSKLDIAGNRYGQLVAIRKVPNTKSQWEFKCDCGNTVTIPISRVFGGQVSCGCQLQKARKDFAEHRTKHGESRTKLYRKWQAMINRCYKPYVWNYPRYGGRGIEVCEDWKTYENFRDWAIASGYDPNLDGRTEQSLDRIDNDGNYCPENCRWATANEQQKNREITTIYNYDGKRITANEFAILKDIPAYYVYRRINGGRTLDEIFHEWSFEHSYSDMYYTVSEYSEKFGITVTTVNRQINNGKLDAIKVGRKWYIKK